MNNPIRLHRTERNLTCDELARLLGVSRSTVARWETGAAMPQRSIRNRLARRLGLTLAELQAALGVTED